LTSILREFYQAGIVEKVAELPFYDNHKVAVLMPDGEVSLSEDELLDIGKARERLLSLALVKFEHEQLLVKAMYEIGSRFLTPNLTQNPNEMEARKQKALDALTGQKGMVLKGELILTKGQKVSRTEIEKISSLSRFRIEAGLKSDPWHFVFPLVGRVFFAGVVILGLALFLYFVKPSVFFDNTKLLMIASILILQMILTYLISFCLNF
jgi:membrane-associated HD superfamily phosphohydrolase